MIIANCYPVDPDNFNATDNIELNCGHRLPTYILRDFAAQTSYQTSRKNHSKIMQACLQTEWEVQCPLCQTRISKVTLAGPLSVSSIHTDAMMLAAIKMNFTFFRFASRAMRTNKGINLEIVKQQGWALKYSPFVDDFDVALAAIEQNSLAIRFVDSSLIEDKRFALAAVQVQGDLLETFKSFQNDEEVVLAAVTRHGEALEYASPAFKNLKRIVLAAVNSRGAALSHASDLLQNDEEVVHTAVKQSGYAFQYSQSFSSHRNIVLDAVKTYGFALQFASPELQNDPEVVRAAVTQNGYALQFASSEMCKLYEILLTAVTQNGDALQFADDVLKHNKTLVLAAVKQFGHAIQYAPTFSQDREIIAAALNRNGFVIQETCFQDDQEMVEIAIQHYALCYIFASERLRFNPHIILMTLQRDGLMLARIPQYLLTQDMVLAAVTQNGLALEFDRRFQDNEIIEAAIQQNPEAIKFVRNTTVGKL